MRMLRRVAAIGALLLATASMSSATTDAIPALRVDVVDPQPIAAVDASGAIATIDVRAFDSGTGSALDASCQTPSGPQTGTGDFTFTEKYPIGTTTVTCTTSPDSSGATYTKSVTVTVADLTPPSLTVPGNITVSTADSSGAVVHYTATATDNVDPSVTVTCSPASDTKFPVGTTTVTCSARDAAGNTASKSFTVTVTIVDTTDPVLTVPSNISVQTQDPSGAVVTYTATATDNVDGSITPTCSPSSGTKFAVGTTTVTCTATDTHGNTSTASFTVTVTLIDTTKPLLTVPSNITVTTTNPGGTAVTYQASATDNLDGSISPKCTPASGSVFPIGTTTVTCTATDSHNNSTTATFTVTVVFDEPPPTIGSAPANITREANGPGGSIATYVAPTATDSKGSPLVVTCTPASGSLFPVGTTTVTCSASNSQGETATTTFTVTIVDTTPPVLTLPGDTTVYATSGAGVSRDDPAVAAFLGAATARDIADPAARVTNDAPSSFPVGTTTVTFVATDASGNRSSGQARLTVLAPPPAGTPPPPLPSPSDRTPPGDVTGLTAAAGPGLVRLTWARPAAADFDHVTVTRTETASGSSAGTQVYQGAATSYGDRSVRNGVEYRYVVVSFDRAGNRSAGAAVVATPKAALLLSPRDGAKLTKPPRLVWAKVKGASYYNIQLFLGDQKILSAWPKKATFTLKRTWKYAGHSFRLGPNVYRWYVWPGLGARSAVKYGPMLGTSSFEIIG